MNYKIKPYSISKSGKMNIPFFTLLKFFQTSENNEDSNASLYTVHVSSKKKSDNYSYNSEEKLSSFVLQTNWYKDPFRLLYHILE